MRRRTAAGRALGVERLEGRAIPGAVVTLPCDVFFRMGHPPNEHSAVADGCYAPAPEVQAARPIVVTPSGRTIGPEV
jgi:hypothetical protein